MKQNNNKDLKKDDEIENPVDMGKKAIEAAKQTDNKDKPKEDIDKEEKEDAEQWRNEG